MKTNNRQITPVVRLLVFTLIAAALLISPKVEEAQAGVNNQNSSSRPIIVVDYYDFGGETIYPGQTFTMRMGLQNTGNATAENVVATFTSGEIVALDTGGVRSVGDKDGNIPSGGVESFEQRLMATWDVWGKPVASIPLNVTYTYSNTTYSSAFNITFPVFTKYVSPTATPTITPTPAQVERPQLIIKNYKPSVDVLEPGVQFSLDLDVENVGSLEAKQVVMIVGGGSSSGGISDGTPVPGGTSGGSGDFTHFAPLGSSNIQSLGDFAPGRTMKASQELIVNTTTEPGAYSQRISFSYVDETGRRYNDDQVITLLVYAIPKLSIDFYQDPGMFFAGQMSMLPIQVVNIGKKPAILGNMRVTADGADIMNNVTLVGYLETGGYFPLDAMLTPFSTGPLDLIVTIEYTDDFNQPQQITKTLTVDVQEAPVFEPPPGEPGMEGPGIIEPGMEVPGGPMGEETLWQKVVRFVKGLFGLGSEQEQPGFPVDMPGGMPIEGEIIEGGRAIPMP